MFKKQKTIKKSKAPTAAQKRTWALLAEIGCIACLQDGIWTQPEIHHIKDYGYHDHDRTYPLCAAHHRPTAMVIGVPSIHHNKLEFIAKFGTEQELLERSRELINYKNRREIINE